MSCSDSPSITQFFKPQRKRPRGLKEDGLESASKKVLLEGKLSVPAGSGSTTCEDEEVIKKPVAVVTEKPVTTLKVVKTEKKSTTRSRKTVKAPSSKEGKISAFVKSTKSSSSKAVVAQPDNEGVTEATGKEKCNDPPPPVPADNEPENAAALPGENLSSEPAQESPSVEAVKESEILEKGKEQAPAPRPVSQAQEEKGSGEQTQPRVNHSPIKFLKVGSLSPTKKKKMTTEQVAKLLRKKTKLSDLKSALEGINQCAQKLSEFRRTVTAESNAIASPAKSQSPRKPGSSLTPSTSASKSIKNLSPANFYSSPTPADSLKSDIDHLSATKNPSPSKFININNKIKKRLFEEQGSPYEKKETKVPAYQRLHDLAQKTAAEKGTSVTDDDVQLSLPYHFKVLKELFMAVETVVGIMKGRKETIIFPKVKAGVMELFKKVSLREKHLAQMVAVLPNCYTFSLEKVGTEYHYKLNVEDLLPSVVCARRKAFHTNLIKICLEHHQKFLLNLVPPIIVPADKQITRWHPKFRLDEQIPEIVPAENVMPIKPTPDKISSAREVIAKAQNILENANPRMKEAVKNMLNKSQEVQVSRQMGTSKSEVKLKALKGVSASLLEKIRNREREKLLNEMTRTPAESKKMQMAKRLPNFIKIIRNTMVAEKKVALPMGTMVTRVCHSMQNMSEGDTEAHLRLLTILLPNWAKIHKLSHSDVEYLRIDKNADLQNVLLEMDDVIKKLS